MKIKIKLSIIFLLVFCLFTISSADVGIGISEVGTISSVTGIEEKNTAPAGYILHQNYPNPFNPVTTISYQLPKSSKVDLAIFNPLGMQVATLVNKNQPVGTYTIQWDASGFASGVYFYKLEMDKGFSQTKKLILLK